MRIGPELQAESGAETPGHTKIMDTRGEGPYVQRDCRIANQFQ